MYCTNTTNSRRWVEYVRHLYCTHIVLHRITPHAPTLPSFFILALFLSLPSSLSLRFFITSKTYTVVSLVLIRDKYLTEEARTYLQYNAANEPMWHCGVLYGSIDGFGRYHCRESRCLHVDDDSQWSRDLIEPTTVRFVSSIKSFWRPHWSRRFFGWAARGVYSDPKLFL